MDVEEVRSLVWPTWEIPFPVLKSKHAEEAEAAHLAWLDKWELLPDEAAAQHYARICNTEGNAWFYPTASLEHLSLLNNYMGWFFILDDQFDEGHTGCDIGRTRRVIQELIAIIYGEPPAKDAPQPHKGLAEVVAGLRKVCSEETFLRIVRSMNKYMLGYLWETENRATQRYPSLSEYIHMRLHTGCLITVYDAVEIAEQTSIPHRFRESLWISDMLFDCANVINWQNDVMSVMKESNQHRVNNLIYVLQRERRCSLQTALDIATQMTKDLFPRIQAVRQQLPEILDFYRLKGTERNHAERWFNAVILACGGCMKWQEILHTRAKMRYSTDLATYEHLTVQPDEVSYLPNHFR